MKYPVPGPTSSGFQGELFDRLGLRLVAGVGLDPLLEAPVTRPRYLLLPGTFPDDLGSEHGTFDAITMLAVLEHVPCDAQPRLATECAKRLCPGGRLVVTVPSPQVDGILAVLQRLRLAKGMSLEEHHGFDPATTPALFEAAGLRPVVHRRFQAGLNHLFVFER